MTDTLDRWRQAKRDPPTPEEEARAARRKRFLEAKRKLERYQGRAGVICVNLWRYLRPSERASLGKYQFAIDEERTRLAVAFRVGEDPVPQSFPAPDDVLIPDDVPKFPLSRDEIVEYLQRNREYLSNRHVRRRYGLPEDEAGELFRDAKERAAGLDFDELHPFTGGEGSAA